METTRKNILFMCHDHNRGMTVNGLAYSPIIDSFSDYFESKGIKSYTIATPWAKLLGKKAYGNVISINLIHFIFLNLHRIYRVISKNNNYSPLTLLYQALIKKINPLFIITVGGNLYLNRAAKKLKIPIFECLHGWGYIEIPAGWDRLESEDLPSGFLSLDSMSTSTLASLSSKGLKVWQIIHPYYCINKNNQNIDNRSKKKILFTLQWGYDGELNEYRDILQNGIIYDKIIKYIKETKDLYYWKIRLHPVQLRDDNKANKIKKYFQANLSSFQNWEIEQTTILPLLHVASDVDVNITMSSSSTYELALLGIKSIVLCPTVRRGGFQSEVFSDLEKEEYVIKIDIDNEKVMKYLEVISRTKPRTNEESIDLELLYKKLLVEREFIKNRKLPHMRHR